MSFLMASQPYQAGAVSPLPGYVLQFADDFTSFNGSPNGTNGWRTQLAGTDGRTRAGNFEAEYYCDTSVAPFISPFDTSTPSILTISASLASVTGANALSLPYNSGSIASVNSFYMTYGWFEMRAKMPPGVGLWPAFWLDPVSGANPPEIDTMEQIGVNTTIYNTIHAPGGTSGPFAVTVADTTTAFHVYAMNWQPDFITFYFDGAQTNQIATPAGMNVPMFIYANLAVGGAGSWPGQPNGSTVFPAAFQIDYIRAYAGPTSIGIGGSLVL